MSCVVGNGKLHNGSNRKIKFKRSTKRMKEVRFRVRSYLSIGVLGLFGLCVIYGVMSKSEERGENFRRRMLSENDTVVVPEVATFCDVNVADLGLRIDAVANSTERFNAYLYSIGQGGCAVDYTDYSSYPAPPVDPCTFGGIVVYVIGLLYTFAGLAIVCDEFFVPALEVMVDVFALSNDVAGATLMAAGGSAPELFTSLMGTFLSKSNVGFGTIVGSAVFNVLFVIGMCALFSKDILCLTWWPLARDSSYYAMSLGVLAYLYANNNETLIHTYEAIILLCLYAGYVTLMKFNERLRAKFEGMLSAKKKVSPNEDDYKVEAVAGDKTRNAGQNPFLFHNQFRSGVLNLMYKDANIMDQAKLRIVTEIKGDVKETFKQLDLDLSGTIEPKELGCVLEKLTGKSTTTAEINRVFDELGADTKIGMDLPTFTKWYMQSEHRVMAEAKRYFSIMDTSNDGFLDRSEITNVIRSISNQRVNAPHITDEELEKAMMQFDKDANGRITFEEFSNWYRKSLLWQQILEEVADVEEEGGPLDLEWPDNTKGQIMFVLTMPIVFPLWLTVPDVRREGREKYYPLTWFLAIAWIAIFSYFMVWWAMLLGDAAGLAPSVMGVTFLAAGTSIPDLITSVIVARQGFGDMAVSSSIGSNIFDILVGLPIPWLLYNLTKGQPVVVVGDDLFWSVIILIGMLVSVIISIAVNKWRMTKSLGITMFALYVVFIAQDLYRQSMGC